MNQDSDHQKAPAASLRAEGITCVRGERCLYEGLCFEAEPGAVLRLAGPNGAGKTTLMRIVAGLLTPTEGKIFCEPSSAITVGAVLQGLAKVKKDEKVCFLISGGSAGLDQLKVLEDVTI